jgi:hypothetical protein
MSEPTERVFLPLPIGLGSIYDNISPGGLGTGSGFSEQSPYPFPTIARRASEEQRARRQQELRKARAENWYNYDLIPGAVVHGNIGSEQVKNNTNWSLRGSSENRSRFAYEDQFGSGDDSDPGEDEIDVLEPLFYYFDKNWPLWATNTQVLNNITRLLSVVTENLTDGGGPGFFRVNVLDPVLTLAPATKAKDIEIFDFYPSLPDRYPKQPFDEDFRDDDVIGWVMMAHSSPFSRLKAFTQHQDNFKVTNDIFRRTDEFRNDDLDQAMAQGRVFIADYKEYHELNVGPAATGSAGGRFYTPIALFAVPKIGGNLKLLAIQSTQHTPANEAERQAWKSSNQQDSDRPLSDILTPTDDYWSWQMAKTLLMSMYAMSSVVDHLSMHVYVAPIAVSFYRNIPQSHPLRALLEPHLLSLSRNNHSGIFWDTGTQMIAGNDEYGQTDQGLLTGMMNKVSGWTGKTFLDATVQRAGFYHFIEQSTPIVRSKPNEFSAIEDFPLHDDNGLFPLIERWARSYLSLYYRSDADVREDYELQEFARDTAQDGKVNGFPESVSTFNALVDLAARIIYWMSVNHALEATLGCEKLAPLGYWSDRVPRNDEVKTEEDWFNILPPINVGLAIFCGSRFFVDLPREWYRSLGRFPVGHFMHDQRVYPLLERFQAELFELDESIKITNLKRRWGYSLMRPSTMTCSPWN